MFFKTIFYFKCFLTRNWTTLQSRDHQIPWSWAIFQRGLIFRDGTSLWFLMRRIRWDQRPQLQSFRNYFHGRNGTWIETDGNLKAQDQGCMLTVVLVPFPPITDFWHGCSCSMGSCWVSASQNFIKSFQLLRIKIQIDCIPVWNKYPLNHTCNIPPDTQYYFGTEPIVFDDDFGTLMGTELLFLDVRVAVKTHLKLHVTILLINVLSMELTISYRQIPSPVLWVCWGVNSWGTDP